MCTVVLQSSLSQHDRRFYPNSLKVGYSPPPAIPSQSRESCRGVAFGLTLSDLPNCLLSNATPHPAREIPIHTDSNTGCVPKLWGALHSDAVPCPIAQMRAECDAPTSGDTPETQNVNVTSISLNPDNRSNGLDRHISLSTEWVANFARIGITSQLDRSPFAISARRTCHGDRSQTPCSIDKRPGFFKKPGL